MDREEKEELKEKGARGRKSHKWLGTNQAAKASSFINLANGPD